jgi:ferric-dicitrate binding protein FerR (iron transport regulator)
MDEHEPTNGPALDELIEQVLAGAASDDEKRALEARLLADAEARRLYLHRLNLHSALRRQFACDVDDEALAGTDAPVGVRQPGRSAGGRAPRLRGWSWAAVAAVVVALIVGIYAFRPGGPPEIATITEMNGALQWTGDGGRVVRGLEAGSALGGGTLESLSADSWAVLTFRDGSTVAVSGQSILTISEDRQKVLHLRGGSLSANVVAQRRGRPMLIHTPTARLEVLGTGLNVEAEESSTLLSVTEGRVRVTRLADGSVVDVPAQHQTVASVDRRARLEVTPRPGPVTAWEGGLPTHAIHGEWRPEPGRSGGSLRAAPMLWKHGEFPITLYLVALSVSRGQSEPVLLTSGGKLRVCGRLERPGSVLFGFTTKHAKGGFAGKFLVERQLPNTRGRGEPMEIELRLEDFRPQDPGLCEKFPKMFPGSPVGLELVDVWCCTINADAGLSATEISLVPSTASVIPRLPTTEPPQLSVVDIWTAASQGNLEAVRRHIDAGVDVDATFVAPGIPASGATPLHLAVLADQAETAEFLIEKGATLGARAGDEHGGTPLHWAAALGRVEMARRLIDAGADFNARDNHGYTPLDATHYDRETQTAAKLEIAELLRAKGAKRRPTQAEEPGR